MKTTASAIRVAALLSILPAALPATAADIADPAELVTAALAHNQRLASARIEVDARAARQQQVLADALPRVRIEASAQRFDGLRDSDLGPGITIPALETRFGASATLSQLVFAGGAVRHGLRAARWQRRAGESACDAAQTRVILESLTQYWTWSKAHYRLDALRAAEARMQAHALDLAHRREAGLATEHEQLAADVLLERTRLRLEDAIRADALARAGLAALTGRELAPHVKPAWPDPRTGPSAADVALPEAALTNRPEVALARADAEAAREAFRALGGGWLPQVHLVGRYEQARPNALFFPPRDEWEDDAMIGAVAAWNVADGGLTAARRREARIRLVQADLELARTREAVLLEVREGCIRLEGALAGLLVARRAEQSARRNLESAQSLWRNGLARHSDVLDAEADLTETESAVVAAGADIVLARVRLAYATGGLRAPPGAEAGNP